MLIFDQLKKNDPQLRIITWGVLAGMAILLIGLWYMQVISHRRFAENQKAQSFRTVRIPAIRGKILDRSGQPLAENKPSYNVGLYLDELREHFRDEWRRTRPKGKLSRRERLSLEAEARYRVVSNIVQNLATSLREPILLDYGNFLKHYTNQLALPLQLLRNIEPIHIARFEEMASNPAGVDLDVQPIRSYPQQTTAAHLLGYLTRDDSSAKDEDAFFNFRLPDYRGRVGIEGAFDEHLRGKAGVKSVLVNSLGYRQSETIWTPAEPGKNVILTIDLAIQRTAEYELRKVAAQAKGAVVVMDPNTGDLLALASSPAFDPNEFIPRISEEDYKKLNDLELRPQINRTCQENYRPGSIFKIVIALACLEAGLNPAEKIYNPPNPADPVHGHIKVGARSIKDTAPPGEYDFKRALIRSSNTYFITNGMKFGIERIVEMGRRLHLGEKTGLPTGQEVSGYFPNEKTIRKGWFDGDTANLCIGQGRIDVTPLQMAVMAAAIANGGKVLYPRLIARMEPQDPFGTETAKDFPNGRIRDHLGVSERTLQIIREAMVADVEEIEGTAFHAFHEPDRKTPLVKDFRVCAKTGTAQVSDEHNRIVGHTVWIASYGPYEAPRYVVLVMVDGGSSGGGTCGPIAREIYKTIQKVENQSRLKGSTLAHKN